MAQDREKALEDFANRLEHALGDNLVSFMLYGPAERAEGGDELTTLLIVSDASPSSLRPMEAEVAQWVKKGHPPPLIFSSREWRASRDVFPIEIEDMREAHRLLKGEDPLHDQHTTKDDLRRELERELRGKLLQLRTEFVAAAADGKALGALLTGSSVTFFVLFRAVLRLAGRTPPAELDALVRDTADVAGLDPLAFDWVLGKMVGGKVPPLSPYDPVGDKYLEQIERLAHFIDAFDTVEAQDT